MLTTTTFCKLFFFGMLCLWHQQVAGFTGFGNDTIKIGNLAERIAVVGKGITIATKQNLTPSEAWAQVLQKESTGTSKVYVGFATDIYWVGFVANNQSLNAVATVLEMDNPQIDSLSVFEIEPQGIPALVSSTGDKHLFSTRTINHRNFVFQFAFRPGEAKAILLKIDKRNSSLHFPVYLWPEKKFNERTYHANLGFGLGFGFITLCLIYALLALIFLRKAVYGWYALWIMSTALYSFTALGFSFQYFYPNLQDFNSYFRIYLEVIILLSLVKFSQSFLSLPKLEPLLNKLVNWVLWVFGALILISVFALDYLEKNGSWFIPIVNVILLTGGILIVWAAIKTYKRQRASVIFYFSAFSFLMISYAIINLSEFGWLPLTDLTINPVLIGTCIEVFIFSIALTYQMGKIYSERNQLLASMTKVQKDLLKSYVEGVEKERERISRELHDDIGSRLGSLKRFMPEHNNVLLEKQIDTLYEDVRAMSHNLASPSLKIAGLHQNLIDFAYETQQKTGVKIGVQVYDLPQNLREDISHHLYRIVQEAINNSIKHASPSEIDIQLFCHQDELVLTIDDNGKGFNPNDHFKGIGIKNMNARVVSLNGIFEMTSTVGRGTNILIKSIPV